MSKIPIRFRASALTNKKNQSKTNSPQITFRDWIFKSVDNAEELIVSIFSRQTDRVTHRHEKLQKKIGKCKNINESLFFV